MSDFLQPKFKSPPVTETVLSVQFEPIPQLTTAHLGTFWSTLGSSWPTTIDAPPLDVQFERFEDEFMWQLMSLQVRLRTDHSNRLQIKSEAGDRMVQIQNSRLTFNWVQAESGRYAGFDTIFPEFCEMLGRFREFLKSKGLQDVKPNQWEITYVNRLLRGKDWSTPSDWGTLLGGFMPPETLNEHLQLESVGGEWHFEIKPKRGRLHLNIQHGRENPQGGEAVFVRLTSRGPAQDFDTVDSGIKLGHDAIVDMFYRLTPQSAHIIWEEVTK